MFCQNCGNKNDENAYVCVHCGVFLKKRSETRTVNYKDNSNTLGVVSFVLGIVSILLSVMLFFHDISSVGMYTEVYERLFYAVDYSITAIMMTSVTFIFSLISKKSIYSSVGFVLSPTVPLSLARSIVHSLQNISQTMSPSLQRRSPLHPSSPVWCNSPCLRAGSRCVSCR